MASIKLDTLSLKDLKTLQKEIVRAIETAEQRQKADAREQVEALAKRLGYTLAELAEGARKPTRAPTTPKYRHPENPALTWSGRGRKPHWFTEALAAGRTIEELAIA